MTYELEYVNAYNQSVTFSLKSGLILSSTEGLTSNTIQTVNSQGINLVGGALQGQSVQPRPITCTGVILGDSAQGRRMLISTILPAVPARLIYDNTWQIDVVPTITPDISRHATDAEFNFMLEAAYPYWRGISETITALAEMEPQFKFPWNLTKPWIFGKRTESQFTNIINNGNVESGFVLIFYAVTAVDDPSVTKVSTLEFIRINRHMVAGETVTIENRANRVNITSNIDGKTTDVFADLDFESTLFMLDIGDNILRYDTTTNRSGLDVRIVHSTTSVGAY